VVYGHHEEFQLVRVTHAGTLIAISDPTVEGYVGWIVIHPDRSRVLARAVCDPLA
jgi:hypothetical protein